MKVVSFVKLIFIGYCICFFGCSVALKDPSIPSKIEMQGKTDLKVAVYDFFDLTNGDHAGPGGSFAKYTNLNTILADITANSFKNSGYFKDVERIKQPFNKESISNHSYQYIVTAEIKKFKRGGSIHALNFINPIALFTFVCLPTGWGEISADAEVRVLLIDAQSNRQVDEITLTPKFGPEGLWSGWCYGQRDNRIAGETLIKLFGEDLSNKLNQSLKGNLGLMLLARDPSASKEFLPGFMQNTVANESKEFIPVVNSDVDALPIVKVKNRKNSHAIVIGIEKYRQKLPRASFAASDANTITSYLTKVLGYPEENVITLTNNNATKSDFEKYFERWLPNNVEEGGTVFVYYSGHGAPNPKSGDAYLVPFDGDPTFIDQTGYSLKRMYDALGRLKAKEVVVALDSCFSGVGEKSVLAEGARPLVMNLEKNTKIPANMVLISASTGDQISSTYKEKGHGLFTYYFLKGIKGVLEEDKYAALEIGELYNYLKPQVERISRKQYNSEQTPQMIAGDEKLKRLGLK